MVMKMIRLWLGNSIHWSNDKYAWYVIKEHDTKNKSLINLNNMFQFLNNDNKDCDDDDDDIIVAGE